MRDDPNTSDEIKAMIDQKLGISSTQTPTSFTPVQQSRLDSAVAQAKSQGN